MKERVTWSEDCVEDLEGLLLVEGTSLGWAGANPSLGLQHRLVGPRQRRTAIRGRQRRVPNVELGNPELFDGGRIQRGPRRRRGREPSADPAVAMEVGERAKLKASDACRLLGENGVWWGEKWFGINQNFHRFQIFVVNDFSLSLSLSLSG